MSSEPLSPQHMEKERAASQHLLEEAERAAAEGKQAAERLRLAAQQLRLARMDAEIDVRRARKR